MTRIVLENVCTSHKSGSKLVDVNLEFLDGEYIVVLGPTGAGPSEILKIIAGLLPVNSGKILFDDIDVSNLPPENRGIGMVFEQFNLFPHLSVIDNLLFGPRMRRQDIQNKLKIAGEIISMVRLDGRENAISRELSGGMQQRVGVARAIVAGPNILLLDQPYRALDAKIRAEMRLEVRNIVKGLGLSCIHSTHETEEAMLVADKIAIFNNGKLEQFGTPEEVFNSPKTLFVASFLSESNIWDIAIDDGEVILSDRLKFPYDKNAFPEEGYTRMVLRQHAIDLYFDKKLIHKDWISLEGKIIKVRILGEVIRITVLAEEVNFIVRDLLNPDLRNPLDLIGNKIHIAFPINEIKLYRS